MSSLCKLSQNGAGLEAIWGKENGIEMLNDVGFKNDFQGYYYIAYKNK